MEQSLTMCPTKAGKGYKVILNHDGAVYYFYTSNAEFSKLAEGQAGACIFRQIKRVEEAGDILPPQKEVIGFKTDKRKGTVVMQYRELK